MVLAIQGRFMMCVADGICLLCLHAEYLSCISLRVTGCWARRKAGYFSDPGWSVNHMQGKAAFPCPGGPKAQEGALQSARQHRMTVWELTRWCLDLCSSEETGQKNLDEQLQSRPLLICQTKIKPSCNNLPYLSMMGREQIYLQSL